MLSFLSFLLLAVLAIIFLVVIFGLVLLGKGIDLIRSLFGLQPKSRFRWNINYRSGNGTQQQTTTHTTKDGVTIIDRRPPKEADKKIFAPDEGEYVEYTEE